MSEAGRCTATAGLTACCTTGVGTTRPYASSATSVIGVGCGSVIVSQVLDFADREGWGKPHR
jgi:hypothetical protein